MVKTYLLFLIIYFGQFIFRAILAIIYLLKCSFGKEIEYPKDKFCIVQPIILGDGNLRNNLARNLINFPGVRFIWLIDKADNTAINIARNFQKTYKNIEMIIIDEIPINVNPKTYKLSLSIPYLKDYCIFLDDDCVINEKKLPQIYHILKENNCVISTVPYYESKGFWSNLLSTSANINSILFYLPTALMNDIKTISGMCYITTKEVIINTHVFEKTKNILFDDLAFFSICKERNIKIIQSTMPNINSIETKTFKDYLQTSKRWTIFANMHIKKYLSPIKFLIVLLAICFPTILFVLSIVLGIRYFMMLLILYIVKSIISIKIRKHVFNVNESLFIIFF